MGPSPRLFGVRYGSAEWQRPVWAVGLGLAAMAGVVSLSSVGPLNAAIWAAWLVWVFALAYGANRLQLVLLRPPAWKGAFAGVVCFVPIFLGTMPASDWAHGLGRAYGWQACPSPFWLLPALLWGLIAPGGVYTQVYQRLKNRAQ